MPHTNTLSPLAVANRFSILKSGKAVLNSSSFVQHTDLYSEMEELSPGIHIKDLGYFCIGTDPTGSGDQFFTTSRKGDNPPVFQVYHDVGETGETIERDGMVEIAGCLSDLFLHAKLTRKQ